MIKITYDNNRKMATGQGCLVDYIYFEEHYELIAIDLSK